MRTKVKSTRFYERTKLELPVKVSYAESESVDWTEQTLTEELTICGAGFTLPRPVEPKHLIKLALKMPKSLRLFDFGKEIYEVWGIVSTVQIVKTEDAEKFNFKIGAALIGSSPPSGFQSDPATLYDLNPILQRQGFWNFRQLPRNRGRYARALENRRKSVINVLLQTLNRNGEVVEYVVAQTKDISESGMSLTAKLESGCSQYVIVTSRDKSLSLLAKVHRVSNLEDSDALQIHLEFISGDWLI